MHPALRVKPRLAWDRYGFGLHPVRGVTRPALIGRRLCSDDWCNPMYVCILCTVSQRMVHEHDREHGLGDGRGADTTQGS
jgi:hypothetical protein